MTRERTPLQPDDPALCAAEAKVFAEAALRMLAEGECGQAANLFYRAFEFAGRAA